MAVVTGWFSRVQRKTRADALHLRENEREKNTRNQLRRPHPDTRLARPGRVLAAGGGHGVRQLVAGGVPDRADAAALLDEKSGRGQRHESHQEGVFNQILPLFVSQELAYCVHNRSLMR